MQQTPFQKIYHSLLERENLSFYIKRDDLIHASISGNKWRKIKYNLAAIQEQDKDTVLTFGGAYSNHIYATAAVGKEYGINTIGIIRGEEVHNPTLDFARDCGMNIKFISRASYREKDSSAFLARLGQEFGDFYVLPEGGTNILAVKGCQEIVDEIPIHLKYFFCACGTGGTLAGLVAGFADTCQIYGVSAIKNGGFLYQDIEKLIYQYSGKYYQNWSILDEYHFGGYAKYTQELIEFMLECEQQMNFKLEQVYTAKTLFAIFDFIKKGYFSRGDTIGMLHTGGLQGRLSEHTITSYLA